MVHMRVHLGHMEVPLMDYNLEGVDLDRTVLDSVNKLEVLVSLGTQFLVEAPFLFSST